MRPLDMVAPLFLLVALLVSCGGDDKPSSTPTPAGFPGASWSLEYTQSGGIAGLTYRTTIDNTGKAKFEDQRMGRSKEITLSAGEVATISALMRAADLPNFKSDQGFPVPDAILSSIKVTSGSQSFGGTLNRISNPSSNPNVATLMQALAALFDANKP